MISIAFERPDIGTGRSVPREAQIEQRVRQKAHEIWVAEGKPDGRDKAHWEMARELVAIEDNQLSTLVPADRNVEDPVEPPEAFENVGEFPDLTDQGEAKPGPDFKNIHDDE